MNHYERLKVTQDAPPEVIRAAYRALANRLQATPAAPGAASDAAQEEMMGLNAAYETLIDPMLRRDYDASLTPSQGWQKPANDEDMDLAGSDDLPAAAVSPGQSATGLPAQESAFAPEPNQVMLGTFIALLLIVLGFAWYYTRPSSSGGTVDAELARQLGQSGVSAEVLDGASGRPLPSPFIGQHPLDGPSIGLKSESRMISALPAAQRATAAQSGN